MSLDLKPANDVFLSEQGDDQRWNEFLFALILTSHETPILTVVMAQFVHELGMEWHLMSATAVLALGPALIITLFGQKYVIRGLKV